MDLPLKNIPISVKKILKTLEKSGFSAYIVGGSVRDTCLGIQPKDWDIATSANPEQIQSLFEKTVYTNTFGTVSIIQETEEDPSLREVQVTPYRSESGYSDSRHPDTVSFEKNIEVDLSRRDFTINALAYNVSQETLIDLYEGLADITRKTLRTVGDPDQRFREDPLRMLRAVRFACQLDFSVSYETLTSIQTNAHLIKNISPERIKDEFSKIIDSRKSYLGISLLTQLGLLVHIIPEFIEGIGCEQKGEHIYDVFQHLLHATQHAADKDFPFHVKLASLFHDIGKPRTREYDAKKDKYTFYGHEVVGAKMTKEILKRLSFSHETISCVTKLVRYHMFFSDTEQITLSAVRRMIVNVGKDLIWDLMRVRECDRVGMNKRESSYRLRIYFSLIDQALRDPISVKMLKIDGTALIHEFHMKPGPEIGWILQILLEEVLEDSAKNTKDFLYKKTEDLLLLSHTELHLQADTGKRTQILHEQAELKLIKEKYKA